MTDGRQAPEAIDAALAELRNVSPSPEFVVRLRARVEETPPPSLFARWGLPAASIAAAIVVAFVFGYDRGSHDVVSLAPARATVSRAAQMPAPPPAVVVPKPRSARPVQRARPVPLSPDVLVPASDRAAMNRLAAALRAGQPSAISMVRRATSSATLASEISPSPVVVAPIRIDPVVVPLVADVPMADKEGR